MTAARLKGRHQHFFQSATKTIEKEDLVMFRKQSCGDRTELMLIIIII